MIPTPPTLAGLFFCLAPAEGAGLLFCPAAIQPHASVYSVLCTVNAIYHTRHKTAHRALQWLFLRLCPLKRTRYQTDTSGYNTACATLERLPAPGRTPTHTRYQRHVGTLCRQAQPPIIIRYIRAQRRAPVMDPCQTVRILQTMPARRGNPAAGARRAVRNH